MGQEETWPWLFQSWAVWYRKDLEGGGEGRWTQLEGSVGKYHPGLFLRLTPIPPAVSLSPHSQGRLCVSTVHQLSQKPAGWMTSTLGDLRQSSTNASCWEWKTETVLLSDAPGYSFNSSKRNGGSSSTVMRSTDIAGTCS